MPSPVLNPASPLDLDGLYLSSGSYLPNFRVFNVTNGVNITDWSVDGGTLSNEGALTAKWTFPNRTGIYHLTASSAGNPDVIVTLTLTAMLPRYWDYRIPKQAKKTVLGFEPYNGPSQSITKSPRRLFYEIGSDDLDYEQFQEWFAFWDWHHPGKKFKVDDPEGPIGIQLFESDSDFDWRDNSNDSYSAKFRIKQAWPYGV